MEQTTFTKIEREVLNILLTAGNEPKSVFQTLKNPKYRRAIFNLCDRGFLRCDVDYNAQLTRVELTQLGELYAIIYPTMKNPFNYKLWTFITAVIIAIGTAIGVILQLINLNA